VTGQTTYYIAVDGYNKKQGNITLNWSFAPTGPVNDSPADAIPIVGAQTTGSNVGANAVSSQIAPGYASVWYTWIANVSGDVVFDTQGSDFDTELEVYKGNVDRLTRVDSNNDGQNLTAFASEVIIPAIARMKYYIGVYGHNGATGQIKLNWLSQEELGQVIPSHGGLIPNVVVVPPIFDFPCLTSSQYINYGSVVKPSSIRFCDQGFSSIESIELQITRPNGKTEKFSLSQGISSIIDIARDAPLGRYSVVATQGDLIARGSFTVITPIRANLRNGACCDVHLVSFGPKEVVELSFYNCYPIKRPGKGFICDQFVNSYGAPMDKNGNGFFSFELRYKSSPNVVDNRTITRLVKVYRSGLEWYSMLIPEK